MQSSVKRETMNSLMQENVNLILWVTQLQTENDKLKAENELLISLIKIEDI